MKQEWQTARARAVVWEHQPVGAQGGRPKLADSVASLVPCCRGQMVYAEGAPVECWYQLVSGTARRFIVRPDRRRQIIGLLGSGDGFGFGMDRGHSFTAQASRDRAGGARYPRSRLEALLASGVRLA